MDLAESLGMLNSAIQYAGAQMGAVRDKKFIREENQKARDFQLEMWNKANEYNMPSAVMQRYKDAGLNPNLIYDNGVRAGIADLASAPGHSAPNMGSKDISKYANIFGGYAQAKYMNLQEQLIDSQVSLNESQESKNIAQAEEARSKIPANLSENKYIQALTQLQDNENAWYDISLPTKTVMLDLQQSIMAGNADMVVQQTKKLIQDTENSKKLTDLQVYAVNNAVQLSWKNYELSKEELGAKTLLWLKTGDAAERNSKANFLNALTNGRLAGLKEKEFDKFSDAQLDILQNQAMKLRKDNAWIDILNEQAVLKGNVNINLMQQQGQYQQLENLNYYNNMILDFTKSLFNFNSKF